jgi:hypothetical protein
MGELNHGNTAKGKGSFVPVMRKPAWLSPEEPSEKQAGQKADKIHQ